jgi:hypothetical protein
VLKFPTGVFILYGVYEVACRTLIHYFFALKSTIFWDITHCSPLKVSRRFGGTCLLHSQGRICRARYQHESRCQAEYSAIKVIYFGTDGQSIGLSWNKAPIWGLRPDLYYCLTVADLMWGALSDERTGLSFDRVTAVVSLLSVCTIYILHVIKRMYVYTIYSRPLSAQDQCSVQQSMPYY